MRPFHNVDEQEMFKRDVNLHILPPSNSRPNTHKADLELEL